MDMRNRQQSRRNKSTDTEEGDPRCLLCSYYDDFIACFSCPLRRLYCLFLISITATIAWFSSPLDLTIWTKSAFFRVKGGSNEFFTYLTVFRGVISFTYQKILLGDRVPLKSGFKMPLILSLILSLNVALDVFLMCPSYWPWWSCSIYVYLWLVVVQSHFHFKLNFFWLR